MALEDRVRALEDEVSILRDQIHNTLLEIQEQILIHYYPELRAKESSSRDLASLAYKGNGPFRNTPTSSATRPVALEEAGSTLRADLAGLGTERFASKNPSSAGAGEEAIAAASERFSPRTGSKEGTNWAAVAPLMEWASDSVERIGRERTIKAIEIYAERGYLDLAIKDTLLQFIALGDEETHVERVSLRAVLDILLKLSEVLRRESDIAAAHCLMEDVSVG